MRAQPLAEHHGFGAGVFQQFVKQRHQFIDLVTVVGLVIEQKGAVARHAHVLQRAVQAALVGVRQIAGLAPARHDARHNRAVFVMVQTLLSGQLDKNSVVHALGQLRQHLGLASAQHDGLEGLANLVKPAVAHHPA